MLKQKPSFLKPTVLDQVADPSPENDSDLRAAAKKLRVLGFVGSRVFEFRF